MKKTALITGASKGIGFAIANAVAPHFENLILVARNKENLEKAAAKLSSKNVVILTADLEDEKEIEKIAGYVHKEYGSLDLLVNDAGAYIGKTFEKNVTEEISRLINLNLRAYALLTNQLLPALFKGQDAQIINISSAAATDQTIGEAVYAATKAGVSAFSNILRKELNSKGIRVTAIQPWGVDTYEVPMPDQLLNPDEIGTVVEFILLAPPTTQIDLIELSHIKQWRGTKPPWVA